LSEDKLLILRKSTGILNGILLLIHNLLSSMISDYQLFSVLLSINRFSPIKRFTF